MPKLIKDGVVTEDQWEVLPKDATAEQVGPYSLVPLSLWLDAAEELRERLPDLGVWIDSDEDVENLPEADRDRLPIIAVNFPSFTDGRGFSTARLLRERYAYQGEIRAIGHFMRDQLFFLQRCGYDAFAPAEPWPEFDDSVSSLQDFDTPYQAASDIKEPLFRRLQRS